MVRPKLFTQILSGTALALGATATMAQPSYAESKFYCDTSNDVPVTMVSTSRGNEPMIRWVSQDFISSGYTPEQRCQEVSNRFQRSYENQTLRYIRTGTINNYPVLCIARREGEACSKSRLIVTFKQDTNPEVILQQLRDFRTRVTGRPLELSKRNGTSGFFAFKGETYVNMHEILVETDSRW